MDKSDINFYLRLGKWVRLGPVYAVLIISFLFLNSYFGFYEELSGNLSMLLGFILLPYLVETLYRDTTMAKSYVLINKLVNRDPELLKQINEYKMAEDSK